jgi:hypothetical protein
MIDLRRKTLDLIALINSDALAFENTDQRSARDPVTKGAAILVPVICMYPPPELVLVILTPGAISPRIPIDGPKFDIRSSTPYSLHAATGMIHWL